MRSDSRPWRPVAPGSAASPYRGPAAHDTMASRSSSPPSSWLPGNWRERRRCGPSICTTATRTSGSPCGRHSAESTWAPISSACCAATASPSAVCTGCRPTPSPTMRDEGAATRAGFVLGHPAPARRVDGGFADEVILSQLATERPPARPYQADGRTAQAGRHLRAGPLPDLELGIAARPAARRADPAPVSEEPLAAGGPARSSAGRRTGHDGSSWPAPSRSSTTRRAGANLRLRRPGLRRAPAHTASCCFEAAHECPEAICLRGGPCVRLSHPPRSPARPRMLPCRPQTRSPPCRRLRHLLRRCRLNRDGGRVPVRGCRATRQEPHLSGDA